MVFSISRNWNSRLSDSRNNKQSSRDWPSWICNWDVCNASGRCLLHTERCRDCEHHTQSRATPSTSRSCSTSSFSSLICSIFLRIVNCGSMDSRFLWGLRNTATEMGVGGINPCCYTGLVLVQLINYLSQSIDHSQKQGNSRITAKVWCEQSKGNYLELWFQAVWTAKLSCGDWLNTLEREDGSHGVGREYAVTHTSFTSPASSILTDILIIRFIFL